MTKAANEVTEHAIDDQSHIASVDRGARVGKSTIVHLLDVMDQRQGIGMTAGFPDDATIKDLERSLTTFFKTRLPESTDPRDFVVDVLMTLPNYRGESSLRTYVFAVARRQLADRYRSRYRHRRPFEPLPDDDELAMLQPGLSTELDRERTMATLRTEVEAMGPPYGEVVRLRIEGLEPREIAERTAIHYHTVRSRLARGLEQLRTKVFGADRVS